MFYPLKHPISILFISLNCFLTLIIFINNSHNWYIILTSFIINLIFLNNNLFLFYILFELTLPLLFLLISRHGSSHKIEAAYFLFIYTLFGSLFLLLGIILYFLNSDNLLISLIDLNEINNINLEILIYLFIFIGFLIKLPLFPGHLWLRYAHAEAPVSGSIMLAGIVLKLAIFGIIIISINLLPNAHSLISPYIFWISIFTLFYITLITLYQSDTKIIIAYSSITHMSIIVLGLFSNSIYGISGSILFSIAHGLSSPGLFILFGDYFYKLFKSRYILLIRGILQYTPILGIYLFLFSLANISFPITLNFTSEILCLSGLINYPIILLLASFTLICSTLITFNLLSKVLYRDYFQEKLTILITKTQFLILFSLLTPIIILGLHSEFLFYYLSYNLMDLLI